MRKVIFTLVAVVLTTVMFSQEDVDMDLDATDNVVVNKHGVSILPEAGDFAIGIDATPIFNLVGNMMRINGGAFNDPMSFDFADGSSIYGKYFLSENTAVRARIDFNMMSRTMNNFVNNDLDTVDLDATVTDTWKTSTNGVNFSIGYEMRRGKGRLQAFYGGELSVSLSGGSKDVYTWGNTMNSSDSMPTITNWNTLGSYTLGLDNARPTEMKTDNVFGLGLNAFVGAEYFLFPNISFGGEFSWGIRTNQVAFGEGMVSTEMWETGDVHARTTKDTPSPGSSSFNLGNGNMFGNIYMMIHF